MLGKKKKQSGTQNERGPGYSTNGTESFLEMIETHLHLPLCPFKWETVAHKHNDHWSEIKQINSLSKRKSRHCLPVKCQLVI